ncbi:MAG: hypothetical protein Q8S00_07695 [Deltaproteobacteria bacterium]|nr:hypothetical protein [Deltaproteobacteria bacterium]
MRMLTWTDYFKHRVRLRGFDLATIEQIVQFSEERYFDTATQRRVVVGHHGSRLVMIPYEQAGELVTPVTIHSTTRQQITFRLRTGRFRP